MTDLVPRTASQHHSYNSLGAATSSASGQRLHVSCSNNPWPGRPWRRETSRVIGSDGSGLVYWLASDCCFFSRPFVPLSFTLTFTTAGVVGTAVTAPAPTPAGVLRLLCGTPPPLHRVTATARHTWRSWDCHTTATALLQRNGWFELLWPPHAGGPLAALPWRTPSTSSGPVMITRTRYVLEQGDSATLLPRAAGVSAPPCCAVSARMPTVVSRAWV